MTEQGAQLQQLGEQQRQYQQPPPAAAAAAASAGIDTATAAATGTEAHRWVRTVDVPGQGPRVAQLMVEAFMDDALWQAVCPDTANRRATLEFVFPRRLQLLGEHSECIVDGSDTAVGHCCFVPPNPGGSKMKLSLPQLLWLGLWQMPFRVGWETCGAFMDLMNMLGGGEAGIVVADPDLAGRGYFALEAMAVAPPLQGKGVGSRMLAQLLARADAARAPTLLFTQSKKNVTFYERAGFTVIEEREVTLRGRAFTSWAMKRLPVPAL